LNKEPPTNGKVLFFGKNKYKQTLNFYIQK
jgi:hypothetical protein